MITQEIIEAFTEAVYPGAGHLALASFRLEKVLLDATEELDRLRTEQERLMRLPEQEWGEVCAILLQILASAARQGFKVNETDAVAAMDRGKMYVDRLRARLAADAPLTCAYCHGNDRDMPCAYPSESKPGCLRDQRLRGSPETLESRAAALLASAIAAGNEPLSKAWRVDAASWINQRSASIKRTTKGAGSHVNK